MKVEAAPTLFLIGVLAFVMLAIQLSAGENSVATHQPDRPAAQLAEVSLSDWSVQEETTQVALLRTPLIGLGQPERALLRTPIRSD